MPPKCRLMCALKMHIHSFMTHCISITVLDMQSLLCSASRVIVHVCLESSPFDIHGFCNFSNWSSKSISATVDKYPDMYNLYGYRDCIHADACYVVLKKSFRICLYFINVHYCQGAFLPRRCSDHANSTQLFENAFQCHVREDQYNYCCISPIATGIPQRCLSCCNKMQQ